MSRTEGIFQLLDTVGDGTGTKDAIGDYSATAQGFKLKHSNGIADIQRVIIGIEDAGVVDSGKYGNDITLTKGINVYLKNSDDEILEQFNSFVIKTNGHWAMQCHDVTRHSWGAGNEVLSIRWTFAKSGQPLTVNFNAGEYLEVELNDDFSGLVHHYFTVQGKYRSKIESSDEESG